jgi:hypothetical protein
VTLADLIERLLLELGPLSGCDIARELGRRKGDVLRELNENPRFERVGVGRGTLWRLVEVTWPAQYDAGEDALCELVRQGRRSPEDALVLAVCVVNGAVA